MPIGAPGVVLWRFSRYFWNAPRKILLSKSKLPTVVEKKNKEIAEIVQKYRGTFG